jgi:hypothetical protein
MMDEGFFSAEATLSRNRKAQSCCCDDNDDGEKKVAAVVYADLLYTESNVPVMKRLVEGN